MGPMNDPDEKPLDPEVERVRQRVMRFMGINLGLLIVAIMAVLVIIVYKTGLFASAPRQTEQHAWAPPANGTVIEGKIALPAGARALSQSLDGDRLSVLAELAGGGQAVFVYDLAQNRVVARLDITTGR